MTKSNLQLLDKFQTFAEAIYIFKVLGYSLSLCNIEEEGKEIQLCPEPLHQAER